MKRTRVEVLFNGASMMYFFGMDKEAFLDEWDYQIADKGYFSGEDLDGLYILINPSNCGGVEIQEVGE